MKQLIKHDIGTYIFTPLSRQVKVVGVQVTQDQILTITNTTDSTMIYCFADSTLGGTWDAGAGTLTLAYDTTSMSETDALQIFVDLPAMAPSPQTLLQQVNINDVALWQNPATGELYTQDVNLAAILGAVPLADGGRLRTKTTYEDFIVEGRIGAAQEAKGISCKGLPSVTVQISGTWAGTMTFEGRADNGTYVVINGSAVNGTALVSTTTAGGIFRFNTAGIEWFQVRCSAYTSGTALIRMTASGEQAQVALSAPVAGSQLQALAQKATTFELNTYDTNIATLLGTAALYRLGFTGVEQVVAPTVNPTQPTSYAGPMYQKYPQYFPRVRVEVGGDQKLPLAQEMGSNRLLVATPELYSVLSEMLFQQKLMNQMVMQVYGITPPNGWDEIK
jgi:hypothetical protein